MYGGLARHPLMTEDAFAVVVCHELGHHLGGAPKKRMAFAVDPKWASNEGESDYFAGLKCLRKYFTGMDNQQTLSQLTVPEKVITACQKSFSNHDENLICQRSAMAGLAVSKFLQVVAKSKKVPDFSSPDRKKVLLTSNSHPEAQCRLDTYFQAALCDKDENEEISNTDLSVGTCTHSNGYSVGFRPRCWMKRH